MKLHLRSPKGNNSECIKARVLVKHRHALPLPVLKNMVDEIFARENKMESASFRTEHGPSVFIL